METVDSGRLILACSSCLFGTIVVHAFYKQNVFYHYLYLTLLITSLMYRAFPSIYGLEMLDRFMAHLAFSACLGDSLLVYRSGHYWLYMFPSLICGCWAMEDDKDVKFHLALHMVVVWGMHAWLWFLY